MNDSQLHILKNFLAEKNAENSARLRDADKFATRRSKFIWHPYVSLAHRFETEQASKGINDLISDNSLAERMFLNDPEMRSFLLECAKIKNKPKNK